MLHYRLKTHLAFVPEADQVCHLNQLHGVIDNTKLLKTVCSCISIVKCRNSCASKALSVAGPLTLKKESCRHTCSLDQQEFSSCLFIFRWQEIIVFHMYFHFDTCFSVWEWYLVIFTVSSFSAR